MMAAKAVTRDDVLQVRYHLCWLSKFGAPLNTRASSRVWKGAVVLAVQSSVDGAPLRSCLGDFEGKVLFRARETNFLFGLHRGDVAPKLGECHTVRRQCCVFRASTCFHVIFWTGATL